MKFSIGDLVELQNAYSGIIFGFVLQNMWDDDLGIWRYQVYWIGYDDTSWADEDEIKQAKGERYGLSA